MEPVVFVVDGFLFGWSQMIDVHIMAVWLGDDPINIAFAKLNLPNVPVAFKPSYVIPPMAFFSVFEW